MVFKWISVKNVISICLHTGICKSDQDVAHSGNHPPERLTAALPKTVAAFWGASTTKRKSAEGECSHGVERKKKCLTNVDFAEFILERGIKSYTERLPIAEERPYGHCWIHIQTKWKKQSWTCYQKLKNGASQRKTRSLESILNRYCEDMFDNWLSWKLILPAVTVCQIIACT